MKAGLIVIAILGTSLHGAAFADPCEAELPTKAGAVFAGTIKYVGDGDSLCVGTGSKGSAWVEVRLADFDAPELSTKEGKRGKGILEREAMGKAVSCTVTKGRSGKTTTYDRVLAVCRVGGVTIGDMLRRAGAPTGGN
jgi:endonuclease YncB( thermonuclease family)